MTGALKVVNGYLYMDKTKFKLSRLDPQLNKADRNFLGMSCVNKVW